MIEYFGIIYSCLMTFQCVIFIKDIVCRIRTKNKCGAVRNSLILTIIVFISTFIGEFAFLANFYTLSFNVLFGCTYVVSVVSLYILCHEKIIYNLKTKEITAYTKLRKTKFHVSSITRINSSNEFLDIYIGEKRIRYGNLFITGEIEFVQYVKNQRTAL